jgi:hypothetical protein
VSQTPPYKTKVVLKVTRATPSGMVLFQHQAVGNDDVANMLKQKMMEVEIRRQEECSESLLKDYNLKNDILTHVALKGGPERVLAQNLKARADARLDIASAQIMVKHCERMIEIQGMWDGVGDPKPEYKRGIPLEWRMLEDIPQMVCIIRHPSSFIK